MLPLKNRADRKLLADILKKGKIYSSENIFLKILSLNRAFPVFSFIVLSKTTKKATERNKIKRRARYIVQNILKDVKKTAGVAVFFRKSVKGKDFYEIKEEMIKLFEKAGILI